MSTTATQLQELEAAILKRARDLANNHIQNGQQQQQHILEESNKRLHQREQHELHLAKTAAEQEYRRLVQASEIKMQAELDQLRWSLIQKVMHDLRQHLQKLSEHKNTYLPLLRQYLVHATHHLEYDALDILVNERDYELLKQNWEEFTQGCAKKEYTLSDTTTRSLGGILVKTRDNRIQIDNTFEGIIERLETQLYQEISMLLFASTTAMRTM